MEPHAPLAATPARMMLAGRIGWLRGAIGAGFAIALTALIGRLALGSDPALPWLVASMGASAVLVFVLPASPLAQPWPVFGSHLVAAAIGVGVHALLGATWLSAGLSVGLAIAAMSLLRCLHPPAGGTVLLTALSSPGVTAAGLGFLVMPLALNVLVLLGAGVAWNRLTGHSYPHQAPPQPVQPDWIGHIEDSDLDAVLAEWDEVLDVSREDLVALVHAVEGKVRARRAATVSAPRR
ncbi:MAG: HPP family protein [Pseudomonadota bacterium]